jgi:hypothetical protein
VTSLAVKRQNMRRAAGGTAAWDAAFSAASGDTRSRQWLAKDSHGFVSAFSESMATGSYTCFLASVHVAMHSWMASMGQSGIRRQGRGDCRIGREASPL